MAYLVGELSTIISADRQPFDAAMGQVRQAGDRAASAVESRFKRVGDAMMGIGARMGAMFTLPVMAGAGGVLKLAADFEQVSVSLETMLGSQEAAKKMFDDLQIFAARTPLQFTDVQKATTLLLNFGEEADSVIPTLKMLGDAAGGDAQRFSSLSLAFAQMSSAGRLMGQDLLQMVNAGFNPLQEISRKTGRSMLDLKKDMESGAISADMVRAAFASATGEGGRFNDLMEKQSKTLGGLFSTLQDNVTLALASIGEALVENLNLKDVLDRAVQGVGRFKDAIIDFTKTNPEMVKWGAAIAGVLAASGPLLMGMGALLKMLPLVKAGMIALTGPVGLAVAALGALAAAVASNPEAFRKMVDGLQGPMRKLLVQFAGLADMVVATVKDMFAAVNRIFASLGTSVTEQLGKMLANAIRMLEGLTFAIRWTLAALEQFRDGRWSDGLETMGQVMAKLSDTFLRFKRPEVFDRVGTDAEAAASSVDKVTSAFDKMMAKMGMGDPFASLKGPGDKDKGAPSYVNYRFGVGKELRAAADGFRELAKAQKEAADAGALDRVMGSIDQMPARIDAATKAQRLLNNATKEYFNQILAEGFRFAVEGFSLVIGKTIAGVSSFKDAMSSFIEALRQQIAQMIAAFVANKIFLMIAKLAGGPTTTLGIMFGSMATGGARMAKGGIVPGGFPNDSFPAQLTSGEAVIPLERLEAMIGSSRGGASRVQVEGVIRGSDIELVMKRREASNYRRNGGARF